MRSQRGLVAFLRVILILLKVNAVIDNVDAIGFKEAFLGGYSTKSEVVGKFTGAANDFVARIEVAIGVVMENIADDASEVGIAQKLGDLFVGGDLAGRDFA